MWINIPSNTPRKYEGYTVDQLKKMIQDEMSFLDCDLNEVAEMKKEIKIKSKK